MDICAKLRESLGPAEESDVPAQLTSQMFTATYHVLHSNSRHKVEAVVFKYIIFISLYTSNIKQQFKSKGPYCWEL